MSTKIVIADDHEIVRIGLKQLFAKTGVSVVAEASGGNEAYKAVKKHRPKLALLDVRMPEGDGISCLARIKSQFPDISVLMLSGFEDHASMARAVALGAAGYVLKTAKASEILSAVLTAAAGDPVWKKETLRRVTGPLLLRQPAKEAAVKLTPRELDVLKQVGLGLTNKEIAGILGVSYETVKEHVQHILRKLNVPSRTEAAIWAVRREIV